MVWVSVFVFLMVFLAILGGYFLLGPGRTEREEVKKRISLLELRSIQREDLPEVLKSELLSDVPLLNRLLSHLNIAVQIERRLQQADMKIRTGSFVLLSLTLFFTGILAGQILRWPSGFGIIVGVLLLAIPSTVVNIKRRLRVKRFMRHFPDALEMFARSLRAGHSFSGAIQLVSQEMPEPIGPEFRKVFDEQNLGIPLRQALVGMAERVDALDVKFFVTAIMIQRETGGNLAEIIDKISHVIRERFRIQGQVKVFTAQARLTGLILTVLPIAMALIINILNPEYMKPLWRESMGRMMLGSAIVMQIIGYLIIRKIIRIKI